MIVLSSEDEAREAMENGEITFQQYLLLCEIILHGIDSSSLYLLDEIPNLVYLKKSDSSFTDPLEQEQQAGFRTRTPVARPGSGRVRGRLGYRFYQRLEEDEQSWYRNFADLVVADRYRVRFRINREKSGRERVVSRSVSYVSRSGPLRRLILGSFTTRLGLGTLFGYAGKRLDFSRAIDNESLLYPDYGGYNGMLIKMRSGQLAVEGLLSVTRDAHYRLVSAGAAVRRTVGRFRPGLIVGLNRLTNRFTDDVLEIPMLGLYGEHRYSAGYLAVEAGRQGGSQVSAGGAVLEGRHRFKTVEVRYSGWSYAVSFVDLTAGSKAGYLTYSDTLEPVGLEYSSRRPGQSGLFIKTIVELSSTFDFSNAVLYATRAGNNTRRQFSSSLIHRLSDRSMLHLTYQGRFRRRPEDAGDQDTDHQVRLEGRFSAAGLKVRCYIGYDARTNDRGHACLFATVRYQTENNSRWQIWSNLGDIGSAGLKYWYLFVRAEWPLVNRLQAAVKMANTYRRHGSGPNSTQLSLELNVSL